MAGMNLKTTGYRADAKRAAWLVREANRRGWSVQQVIDLALDVFQQISRRAVVQPKVRK